MGLFGAGPSMRSIETAQRRHREERDRGHHPSHNTRDRLTSARELPLYGPRDEALARRGQQEAAYYRQEQERLRQERTRREQLGHHDHFDSPPQYRSQQSMAPSYHSRYEDPRQAERDAYRSQQSMAPSYQSGYEDPRQMERERERNGMSWLEDDFLAGEPRESRESGHRHHRFGFGRSSRQESPNERRTREVMEGRARR